MNPWMPWASWTCSGPWIHPDELLRTCLPLLLWREIISPAIKLSFPVTLCLHFYEHCLPIYQAQCCPLMNFYCGNIYNKPLCSFFSLCLFFLTSLFIPCYSPSQDLCRALAAQRTVQYLPCNPANWSVSKGPMWSQRVQCEYVLT